MPNAIIITEKPSVAQEYVKTLQLSPAEKKKGYIEGFSPILNKHLIITWAVGHLCTMSYPDVYDVSLKKWSLNTLPFLPETYKYEVIKNVKGQFDVVKSLYHLSGIEEIYFAGDSGREGLYIQLLIRQLAGTNKGISEKVVWIDSFTDKEILRGISDAKDLSFYKTKIDAAYERAIEDYAVGINFTRALSCKFGFQFNKHIGSDKWTPIAAGRVMSCVLGMIVEREREIRNFTETSFYRVVSNTGFLSDWKVTDSSAYHNSPFLYNETGFKTKENASLLVSTLQKHPALEIVKITVKDEKKNAPLLFNLAELQFFCSKKYHLSPEQTLGVAQKLYEYKLTTYPRTDARVISSAVAEEIGHTLNGLAKLGYKLDFIKEIAKNGWHKSIGNTQYVDDTKITDHYAIVPTGNISEIPKLTELEEGIYIDILERFLCIFFPPCVYTKADVSLKHIMGEMFFGSMKTVKDMGWTALMNEHTEVAENTLSTLQIGTELDAAFEVKEGKTTPPKHYTSGSMILAMENAGKMIEDEELRAQIKSCGIGTSATRSGILKKLCDIHYIDLKAKTQVLTPTPIGEACYDIIFDNMPALLKPEMTASWERGLAEIEDGSISAAAYRKKLEDYVTTEVNKIKSASALSLQPKGTSNVSTPAISNNPRTDAVKCPFCNKGYVRENAKSFSCSEYRTGCPFVIWKSIAGINLTQKQVDELINGQQTEEIIGFKKKDGTTFDAALKLVEGKTMFVFVRHRKKK